MFLYRRSLLAVVLALAVPAALVLLDRLCSPPAPPEVPYGSHMQQWRA